MIRSWLENTRWDKEPEKAKGLTGFVFLLGGDEREGMTGLIDQHALDWQRENLHENERDLITFHGQRGPVWILRQKALASATSHGGRLEDSPYAYFRDHFGALVSSFKVLHLDHLAIEFRGTSAEQELGALVALEIAGYHYRDFQQNEPLRGLPQLWIRSSRGKIDRELVAEARARGEGVNIARHLVNLPPNELNPTTYAGLVKNLKWPAGLQVNVWDERRLAKEGMGFHLGVGQGAEHPPCLVHLRWRPGTARKVSGKKTTESRGGLRPVAFVGKGITFDSGGLDIKPAAGMRLMKKDMGGSAAVLGVALWAARTNYPGPLDFYLALAENAVDAKAFRPSDVLVARNGLRVEIDNTDAEGRLVLADALDVAVTQKGPDDPEVVINVATLTGAIKVALGADIAGLFSNDDRLAEALNLAGQEAGDLNWRMPLAERYWGGLSSPFADFKNSGDGFGGAITAALFLSRFVKRKPWAHLDIYSWVDKSSGPYQGAGGSGQAVQALVEYLERRKA